MTPQYPGRSDRDRDDDEPETSSFPPVGDGSAPLPYQPQYVPGRELSTQPRRSGLAAVLLAILIIGALALGVWVYNAFLSGGSADGEGPTVGPATTTTLTVPPVSPTTSMPEETTETTETTAATAPTEMAQTPEPVETPGTTEATEATETTTVTAAQRPQFRAPSGAEQCAANVNWRIFRATGATSCGFAENVAIEMAGNSGQPEAHTVRVESPATGQTYTMSCAPEDGNSFTCRGGDNAVVVLEDRAVRD